MEGTGQVARYAQERVRALSSHNSVRTKCLVAGSIIAFRFVNIQVRHVGSNVGRHSLAY